MAASLAHTGWRQGLGQQLTISCQASQAPILNAIPSLYSWLLPHSLLEAAALCLCYAKVSAGSGRRSCWSILDLSFCGHPVSGFIDAECHTSIQDGSSVRSPSVVYCVALKSCNLSGWNSICLVVTLRQAMSVPRAWGLTFIEGRQMDD